ncbi:MAG UNVERIFIED_CONTAM: hypothetical protein LVR18_09320 [Planctomycetaceae bacterium]
MSHSTSTTDYNIQQPVQQIVHRQYLALLSLADESRYGPRVACSGNRGSLKHLRKTH